MEDTTELWLNLRGNPPWPALRETPLMCLFTSPSLPLSTAACKRLPGDDWLVLPWPLREGKHLQARHVTHWTPQKFPHNMHPQPNLPQGGSAPQVPKEARQLQPQSTHIQPSKDCGDLGLQKRAPQTTAVSSHQLTNWSSCLENSRFLLLLLAPAAHCLLCSSPAPLPTHHILCCLLKSHPILSPVYSPPKLKPGLFDSWSPAIFYPASSVSWGLMAIG